MVNTHAAQIILLRYITTFTTDENTYRMVLRQFTSQDVLTDVSEKKCA